MLKEIRRQPEHIRALFMWLSVFIVFSLVIFIWANSFQQKLVLLLNPPEEEVLAEEESPFAVIAKSATDLKATILDLFGLVRGTRNETEVINSLEERFEIGPNLLPLSEDKKE